MNRKSFIHRHLTQRLFGLVLLCSEFVLLVTNYVEANNCIDFLFHIIPYDSAAARKSMKFKARRHMVKYTKPIFIFD